MSNLFVRRLSALVFFVLLLSGYQAVLAATPVLGTITMTNNANDSLAVPARIPLWTFKTMGAVWSSPTVQDGVVYVGSDDNNLYAVESKSGQLKWKFETGGLVRSRPAVNGSHVYIASDDGYLYALETQSGQKSWKLDIGNGAIVRIRPGSGSIWDYLQSSPTITDGVIYIGGADGNVYAVNVETGQEKWRFKTGKQIRATPAVADGSVYVASWDGFNYAIDATNGQEKWRFDVHGQYVGVQSSPAVANGIVYLGSRNYRLYGVDAKTGKEVWKFNYHQAWTESSPTVVDGMVYIGSSEDRYLYAIDSATGEEKWRFATGGYAFSSPTVADGVVYIGGAYTKTENQDGNFYAVDIQTGQANKILMRSQATWQVKIDPTIDTSPVPITGVVSSPTVSNGIVYFGGLDGKLYAVSTTSN